MSIHIQVTKINASLKSPMISLNLACRKSLSMPMRTAILCLLSGRAVLHLIHAHFHVKSTSAVVLKSYVLIKTLDHLQLLDSVGRCAVETEPGKSLYIS